MTTTSPPTTGMAAEPRVDVIIPTTCVSQRWESLQRAIASVLSQRDAGVRVLVLVNGDRFDADRLAELRRRTDITVHYQKTGSLPLALQTGRTLVRSPFFAFLDDDDEYLEEALALRLQPLLDDPSLDFAVTSGLKNEGGADRVAIRRLDAARINAHPLRSLAVENWLASCGGLFRSSRIGVDYFDGVTKFYEWTLLAYKLALDRRMVFIDRPTWRVHDSADSLSKSTEYRLAEVEVLREILALGLPADVHGELRRRIGAAHHDLSEYALTCGRRVDAWKHHLMSLSHPGGLRYLSYSRHLVWPA